MILWRQDNDPLRGAVFKLNKSLTMIQAKPRSIHVIPKNPVYR